MPGKSLQLILQT